MTQRNNWNEQWEAYEDTGMFLFKDWIWPNTLETFKGKTVLDAGCGGGDHILKIAPYAKRITGVDLFTIPTARKRVGHLSNVTLVEADLLDMDLHEQFDVVFAIGVVQHTDDPDLAVANLVKHTKPGGRLILWDYSSEGNFIAEKIIEPLRKSLLSHASIKTLKVISEIATVIMYVPIYTIYLLPLRFLPYYQYFANFRKLSYTRNVLNMVDKLNAPQTQFITWKRACSWFPDEQFKDIFIDQYAGVSWRTSGTKR
jgi:2-polyprenyl-3-methyl-5-hydroxy-6-metoxy-1,4-benzoquinol methylase